MCGKTTLRQPFGTLHSGLVSVTAFPQLVEQRLELRSVALRFALRGNDLMSLT